MRPAALAVVAAILLIVLMHEGDPSSASEADLAAGDDPATPSFPSPGEFGPLAFIRDGNMWVKPVPDGPDVQLTEDGGYYGPSWSPRGEWLAVQRNGNVVLLSRDGRRFEAATLAGRWSPVCDELAYRDSATGELKLLDPETQAAAVVWAPGSNQAAGSFAWSPDGTRIALALAAIPPGQPISKDDAGAPGDGMPLLLLDVATGTASELVRSRCKSATSSSRPGAPTGKASSLTSPRRGMPRSGVMGSSYDISTLQQAGSQISGVGALLHLDRIAAGPKSTVIVAGGWRETWKRLFVAPVSGGPAVELGNVAPLAVSSASFDPVDGTRLAYAAGLDLGNVAGGDAAHEGLMQRRIYVCSFLTESARQLLDDRQYRDERPLWSLNGESLLFTRIDRDDGASIWLASADGGQPREVVGGLALDSDTGWFGYYGNIDWDRLYDWWPPGGPAWVRD